ncbi:SH3 domain-containing protein [Frigidibacter sp. RF13]|uniref:SH3 domain-containing protein n=1 Tax=Frigidibacter sp. RF13 TaxID=2997340 RepID=UPI00226EE165|nr:SH3 domain-containing protein [Frigidibacter sp. RF13]MCY1127584.1 SH3 domain-containing protein [Frigidibacter sp. RF13]
MRFRVALVIAILLSFPLIAGAQEERTVAVHFPAGSSGKTIKDTIVGYESVLYVVGAEAGQRMSVDLFPSNGATYFNIYRPGRGPGDEALASSGFLGEGVFDINRFEGVLPASGDYTISVYLMRSAARRNERSDYSLGISISGAMGEVITGDFADGLAGGPDYLAVSTSGGPLNLRSQPSAGSSVVKAVPNRTQLRNLGCRMSEGRRWCRVATLADPGYEGWAAGDYLVEGSGAATQLPEMPAAGGEGSGSVHVKFAPGASEANYSGTLAPGESRSYVLGARNGQFLDVAIAGNSLDLSYQIFNPDRSFLLEQINVAKDYRGQLWQSGDHIVEVINRSNATINYQILLRIK